jgi:hypothetical protein
VRDTARATVNAHLISWAVEGYNAVDIILNHLLLLDGRASARLEILDLPEVQILYRNLFLTVALILSERTEPFHETKPLRRVIANCLTTVARDRHAVFDFEALGRLAASSDLIVQRQIVLFGHFMLNLPLGMEVIDWDEIFDSASLARLLHISQAATTLPNFILGSIPLADDWLELMLPPYNFNIVDMEENTGVCLLTGQQIAIEATTDRADHVTVLEQLHKTWKDGPMLLMHLTGRETTKIMFTTLEFNAYVASPPAWLDPMGTPDFGLEQGKLLSLNRTVLAEVIDDLASGKFHLGLR